MKNKKGFTLIELLAVIIILGILMIIAIPSVTQYINNSRKSAYVDTAKEIIAGARNLVNKGDLEMFSTETTYYIPASMIGTENGQKSPYGDFEEAYVAVTFDGKGYNYYWISVDETGQGVKNITRLDKLDEDDIESDIEVSDITSTVNNTGIGGRKIVNVLQDDNTWDTKTENATNNVSSEGGKSIPIVCIPATQLHNTTICNRTDSGGCNATGHIGNGNRITYGTIMNGTPKAGDAFDCKVTQDGEYTERFYYVGSEGNNSLLIYYKNMDNQTMYAYDSSGQNNHGPRTAYNYLPDTSTWNNPGIITPGTRTIKNEDNGDTTNDGTIEIFTYTDKAARLLTYQEVAEACGSSNMSYTGYLNSCTWLMENIGQYEGSTGAYGYWLETPRKASSYVWRLYGYDRLISTSNPNSTAYYGVRPVITISKESISY